MSDFSPSKVIALSGGFDPLHVGHINMIKDAANYGKVLIILNSDAWLSRKKDYVFMPWEERRFILEAMQAVHKVVAVEDSDGTVVQALTAHEPDVFANGGDRIISNTPEIDYCFKAGIRMMWNVGGGKSQSSSDLVKEVVHCLNELER